MIEPLTVTVGVAALVQSCLNSIDFVLATHAVYVNADLTLLSLQTQCSCIAVALAEAEIMLKPGFVHRTDRGSRSLNEGHTHVRANFSDLLASYTYVFNSLQQRLDYLVRVIKGDDDRGNSRRSHREDSRNARSHLSRWSRLKFVWNQHEMNKLLRDVTSQTASLEFVLSVLRIHCDIEAAPSVAFPLAVSVLDNVDRNAQLFKGGDDGIDSLVHDPGVMDMNAGNQEDDVLPFHQISISHGDRGRRKSRGRANTRNSKHTGPARRCDRVALGFSWNHLETETESESESEEDSLSRVKRCRIRLNERFPRSSRLDSRTDSLSPSPSRSSCCSIIPPPPASTYTINRVFDIFVAREMFLLMSMPASSSASPQPQFPLPSSWYFCRHQIQPNASSSQDQLRVQHPSQPQARSHHTDISCGAATHFRRLLALPPEQKWRVLHETKHRRDGSNWEDCNDGDWDSDRDYWSDDGVVNRSSRHSDMSSCLSNSDAESEFDSFSETGFSRNDGDDDNDDDNRAIGYINSDENLHATTPDCFCSHGCDVPSTESPSTSAYSPASPTTRMNKNTNRTMSSLHCFCHCHQSFDRLNHSSCLHPNTRSFALPFNTRTTPSKSTTTTTTLDTTLASKLSRWNGLGLSARDKKQLFACGATVKALAMKYVL